MTKKMMQQEIACRMQQLKKVRNASLNGMTTSGTQLTKGTAQQYRTLAERDMRTIDLIKDILKVMKDEAEIPFSEKGALGWDRLIYPRERKQ